MNNCFPRSIEPWEKLPTESGNYDIFGSQIQFMDLELIDEISFDINVIGYGQDYALFMWVSIEPYGSPITYQITNGYSLRPNIKTFTISTTNNAADYTIPAGFYYLNVMNKTNADNIWKINFSA